MVFILGAEAYENYRSEDGRIHTWILRFFLAAGILITLSPIAVGFVEEMRSLPNIWVHAGLIFLIGLGLLYLWRRYEVHRLVVAFAFVALFRLGFDLMIIPHRYHFENSLFVHLRDQSDAILEVVGDKTVLRYNVTPVHYEFAYYIGTACLLYTSDAADD